MELGSLWIGPPASTSSFFVLDWAFASSECIKFAAFGLQMKDPPTNSMLHFLRKDSEQFLELSWTLYEAHCWGCLARV